MQGHPDQRPPLRARSALIGLAILATLGAWTGTAGAQPKQPDAALQRPPHGPPHGPPPEALEACKTLAAGHACSVTLAGRLTKGSCWAPPGLPLACRPADASARPHSHPPAGVRPAVDGKPSH